LNPELQIAREQSAEMIIGTQKIRRDRKKLKDIIDTIVEEASEAEAEAKDQKKREQKKCEVKQTKQGMKRMKKK
jgi:hypothetical protein